MKKLDENQMQNINGGGWFGNLSRWLIFCTPNGGPFFYANVANCLIGHPNCYPC
jgi:bacteriocin-like protein